MVDGIGTPSTNNLAILKVHLFHPARAWYETQLRRASRTTSPSQSRGDFANRDTGETLPRHPKRSSRGSGRRRTGSTSSRRRRRSPTIKSQRRTEKRENPFRRHSGSSSDFLHSATDTNSNSVSAECPWDSRFRLTNCSNCANSHTSR